MPSDLEPLLNQSYRFSQRKRNIGSAQTLLGLRTDGTREDGPLPLVSSCLSRLNPSAACFVTRTTRSRIVGVCFVNDSRAYASGQDLDRRVRTIRTPRTAER